MRVFVPLLFLLLKLCETASSSSLNPTDQPPITRNSSKRSRSDLDELEEGEIVNMRKSSRNEVGFRFDFFQSEPKPNRQEILSNFVKFNKRKVDEVLESDYDIFSNGIWSDLIKLKNYKAIKYMLLNHFTSNEFHRDVFEESIRDGSISLAIFLIQKSSRILKADSARSLALACDFERYKILKAMQDARFDPNQIIDIRFGKTQMHLVVEQDNLRLAQALTRFRNLEINFPDAHGNTPLHYVKSVEMAEFLLKHGADPSKSNRNGIHVIEFVSRRRDHELVLAIESTLAVRLRVFLKFNRLNDFFTNTFKLNIDRQAVLEDSFTALDTANDWYKLDSKSRFKISFAKESGIDQGGLTREWMSLLIDKLFVPRLPEDPSEPGIISGPVSNLREVSGGGGAAAAFGDDQDFTLMYVTHFDYDDSVSSDGTEIDPLAYEKILFYYAPFECVDSDNKLYTISSKFTGPARVYKFIGSVIAKAFIMQIPLKVKLVPSLMKLIMGRTLTFEDLKADDPVMYRSMAECLEPGFDFGAAQYTLPSDETVAVDAENVFEFLDETAVNAMYYRHREQIDELILGFRSIIDYHSLKTYFSADEVLEVLLGEETMDRSDLRSVFDIRDGYWLTNSEIFWSALDVLEIWELIELVRFITGINGLPYGGVKGLGKKLTVFGHRTNQFIQSSTCSYHLTIPVGIETVESLVESLRISLASSPEFSDGGGCC